MPEPRHLEWMLGCAHPRAQPRFQEEPPGAETASSTRQPVVCCQVATQCNVPVSPGNFRLSGNRKLPFIIRKTQGEGQRGRTGCS